MDLKTFSFPVAERQVAVYDGGTQLMNLLDQDTYLPADYKAIVRADTNEVISIVRNSYKIVKNEELINDLMEQLVNIGASYKVDPSHSFCDNNRMRLQITFPELIIKDKESDIALSLFLHNSYDMSEGVRVLFGAIRAICTNGMVFGKILGKFYGKHTQGFSLKNTIKSFEATCEKLPVIQKRIHDLDSIAVNKELLENIQKEIGKRMTKRISTSRYSSQWELYNAITHIISHDLQQQQRARYQMGVSKVFGL